MLSYIHSATVLVRDQDAALDFYVGTLGFEKRGDSPYGDGSRFIVVGLPGERTLLALLRSQDTGQPAGQVSGNTGISLICDDVQKTYEELSAKGVNFTSPPERMPWGIMATWFSDPDGNSFFLTQE